jgi:hypothetical protein
MCVGAVADLEYDAARARLTGLIAGQHFNYIAYSGSSRGHKPNVGAPLATKYLHAQANSLLSHLATTKTVENKDGSFVQRGGTLPPGHHRCRYLEHHSVFGKCIQLVQTRDALPSTRPSRRSRSRMARWLLHPWIWTQRQRRLHRPGERT